MFAKRVARALNVMIKIIVEGYKITKNKGRNKAGRKNTNDTMEMLRADEVTNFVYSINKYVNWTELLRQEKFTSVELDIKEQFTSLDRIECTQALMWICEKMKEFVYDPVFLVMKRVSDKEGDRMMDSSSVTVTNKRYAHVLSLKDIFDYVKFEMEHTYVSVGDYVARQNKGLPIGGIVSAPMASIDAMFKEFSNKKIWNNRGYAVKCGRFRDDIRVLVG